MMTRYRDAFKEVYTILKCLQEQDYEKIPQEIIEAISKNMSEDYFYEMDEEVDIFAQEMLPETKAILFNLFRDYLSEPWQREKIIKMQEEERQKNELKKREQYNTDVFANKRHENEKQIEKETLDLVEYKENIFKKILNKIKSFFLKS